MVLSFSILTHDFEMLSLECKGIIKKESRFNLLGLSSWCKCAFGLSRLFCIKIVLLICAYHETVIHSKFTVYCSYLFCELNVLINDNYCICKLFLCYEEHVYDEDWFDQISHFHSYRLLARRCLKQFRARSNMRALWTYSDKVHDSWHFEEPLLCI